MDYGKSNLYYNNREFIFHSKFSLTYFKNLCLKHHDIFE